MANGPNPVDPAASLLAEPTPLCAGSVTVGQCGKFEITMLIQ